MGSDKRIFDFNNEFHKQGYEITFLLPTPMRELLEADLRTSNIEKKAKINGMLGFHMAMPQMAEHLRRINPLFALPIMVLNYLRFAFKKMRMINPDLVILNLSSHFPAFLGLIVAKLFQKKVICDVPDLITEYVQETFKLPFKRFLVNILGFLEEFVIKHTDHNITCTKFIADYFIRRGISASRFSVVYTGIYPDQFTSKESTNFPKNNEIFEIDYAGRIDDWTGLDIVVDAAEQIKRARLNARFNLFGHGNAKARLEKMAASKGLSDQIIFHGFIPHDQIIQRYNQTDIALCLFQTSILTHAAMPVKLFEYLSMQLPVIVSNLKGIREIVHDGIDAIVLRNHTGDDLYNAVLTLIRDRKTAFSIARKGRELVEKKFEWGHLAREYIAVLKRNKVI